MKCWSPTSSRTLQNLHLWIKFCLLVCLAEATATCASGDIVSGILFTMSAHIITATQNTQSTIINQESYFRNQLLKLTTINMIKEKWYQGVSEWISLYRVSGSKIEDM